MKNIITNTLFKVIVSLALIASTACTDYLNQDPIDSLDPNNFFRDESEIRSAIVGVYSTLEMDLFIRLDRYTDNIYGFKDNTAKSYQAGEHTAYEGDFLDRWALDYNAIGRANLAIDGIQNSTVDEQIKSPYLGEALFLRGFYYFDLTQHFGDVPLLIEKPSVAPNDILVSRETRANIIAQIIKDLDAAVELLPLENETGRVSKGAALALKARVMLFDGDMPGAAAAAKAVMDLGVYGLFKGTDAFKKLFWEENEDNEEVVFSIKYMTEFKPSLLNKRLVNSSRYAVTLSLANEFEMANGKLIDEADSGFDPENPFDNRDPRFDYTILKPGGIQEGLFESDGTPTIYIPTDKTATSMRFNKFVQWDRGDWEIYDGQDWIMIRYAEVLLMFAEATNEISGATTEVYDAINDIRSRAGMPDLPTGLSKEAMRDRIRHERRVELAAEGLRLYDINRWQIGPETATDLMGYDKSKLKDPNNPDKWKLVETVVLNRSWNTAKGYLWPIPGIEREVNPKLTQNSGYGSD
ncbi:RagB/SusD family nutrient uptake outer membrane protein [Reichenbachiella sp. MALMAid0571]|uniref:RagB/SusD family nutrient uptake outer membrane protein n=1 Tax=Reichenbachiella sp. MALMAid0571 TaxID=3143939 RepID=UPI0032DE7444